VSTHTAGLCSIGFLLAIRTAKLKLLMEMPDAGPITEEEYDKTKAAILARMQSKLPPAETQSQELDTMAVIRYLYLMFSINIKFAVLNDCSYNLCCLSLAD
jgi:hypothetical protein